ncbi:MAG TPA: hypothetical protein DEA44_16975 [Firmicutes bacterium]|jgi:DNA-directed RNA polymerase alpha subunit|nr:hypothetical protein [Bacillota bacterium]
MEKDVRRYFYSYIMRQTENISHLVRIANELYRGGVTDMDTLCELLENHPGKVRSIRNIGEKSVILAQEVCKAYRQERGDSV